MALPSTGGTYKDILEPGLNPTAVRKGIVTDILIRDYHGAMTDLSDPAVGLNDNGHFSPFAEDGLLRDDLLITAEGENLGFYHIGLLTEDGVTYTPNVDIEETMAAQSRRNVRVDISKESDRIKFVAEESTPLIDALMDDVPLLSLSDVGSKGYSVAKPAYGNIVERQIIALLFDGLEYAAKIIPRANRSDVGETNWNKKNPDVLDVSYDALLCPYAGYPVLTVREGEGWRSKGGYPNFGLTPPVATQTGATTATVAFAVPTGLGDPWTYTVEKSVSPFSSWTTATVGGASGTTTVTLSITGLTTATQYKFRVTAEGSNGLTSLSQVSNTITTA
jgi:hypothetical protein